MLEISNLTKTYKGSDKPAVNHISFNVSEGEIFGFIGPNGAGKSTTIKCICGILGFDGGHIMLDGKDVKQLDAKRQIGYVSDNHVLFENLTGLEFVNFMCDVYEVGSSLRAERLDKYLALFNLADKIKSPIKSYSHGMKQKINIIGALIHEPKLWVLDEPLTGLDPTSAYELKKLMREHANKGNIVFFSSHVLDVVEKVCDKVGIIDDGNLVMTSSVDDVRRSKNPSLEELFIKITSNDCPNDYNACETASIAETEFQNTVLSSSDKKTTADKPNVDSENDNG